MSTPGSVAVITREEMDVRRVQSIRDLVRYAPGVYFSNDNDFRFQPLKARGFDIEQYLDGLRLQGAPFGVARIDPWFLDRAEIITGPASVIYGAASPGGILNMVSKRPTETPFGEVSLQTGSFDRIQGAFDVGGPVDKDKKLLYRVTGLGLNANTQVDNIGEQRFSIAPAWTWRPDIDTTITFLTSYRQDPKGGAFALLPIQGTLVPAPTAKFQEFLCRRLNYESLKYKQATLGYEFEHRFRRRLHRAPERALPAQRTQLRRGAARRVHDDRRRPHPSAGRRPHHQPQLLLHQREPQHFAADTSSRPSSTWGRCNTRCSQGSTISDSTLTISPASLTYPTTSSTSLRRTIPRTSRSPRRYSRTWTSTCSNAASTCRTRPSSAAHCARRHPIRLGRGQYAGPEPRHTARSEQ
jgi:outer membrane receptor protein involved in Fe transport